MGTHDRVRILVLGDSGVGKTSLVHLISKGKPLNDLSHTIGASVDVSLHEYREGTSAQNSYWIELYDVGGFHSHRNARPVYYSNMHGIMLVHDLSNRKSQENLERWLREFMDRESGSSKLRDSNWDDYNSEIDKPSTVDVNIPLLVVGTKQDVAGDGGLPVHQRRSFIAEEYLTEEIQLNCHDEKALTAGSSNSNKMARFFDKVIEKTFFRRENSQSRDFNRKRM